MLLSDLTQLPGVSGCEDAVRNYIYENIKAKCDEITFDSIGNMTALMRGTGNLRKKVLLCAHMDEIGMITSRITDDGFLKFKTVGGIDPRVMVSKRVLVGNGSVPGVIGYKAVHLQEKSERETTAKSKSLYIDIGAKNKKDAEKRVKIGDCIVFDSEYRKFGDDLIKARALDDRAGCAILTELCGCRFDFDLYICFTVQEEVGLRGAKILANRINPDLALVIESTTCSDVYGTEPEDYSTELGKGVALSIIDRTTYYNKELTQFIYKLAQDNGIPIQYKKTAMGGNEAGAIHLACGGVKTAALSIPARYIHSPSSVISKKDFDSCAKLVHLFLKEADKCLNY
ncbi:MAG: M42 family metallopeptidase [Clostridia bacterium]|nr:M42 family metallopeptidase [Clostridia bacterium]